MMKNLFWLLLMMPFCVRAQTNTEMPLLRKSLWRVTVFKPGLVNEVRFGKYVTLATSVNLWGGYSSEKEANQPALSNYYTNVQANTGLRYYYNLNHRAIKGKSIRYNSGNYFSLSTQYNSNPVLQWGDILRMTHVDLRDKLAFQALWGHQATLPSRIYADISVGIQKTTTTSKLEPVVLFRIGYTFSK